MIKNFLLVSLRSLLRKKTFTIINAAGLAMGLSATMIIMVYISFELSYDRFHKDVDTIYRAFTIADKDAAEQVVMYPRIGPTIKENIPSVENMFRTMDRRGIVEIGEGEDTKVFKEEAVAYVDAAFFEVLDFEFSNLMNSKEIFADWNEVVISESLALKYFNNTDVIGESIVFYDDFGEHITTITGVMRDMPQNSHIQYDLLFSMKMMENNPNYTNWNVEGWGAFVHYFKLQEDAKVTKVEEQINALLKQKGGIEVDFSLALESLKSIHLYADHVFDNAETNDVRIIYLLVVIALFILLIAWINYINLTTAYSLDRAMEVGIRKVMGANRFQLIRQFLLEAIILNSISLVLSFIIIQWCLPYMSELVSKDITLLAFLPSLPEFQMLWFVFFMIWISGVLISGLYPAVVLSSYKPALVLKGKFSKSGKGIILRKSLVIFQFAASLAMITGTIIVHNQVNFMRSQALGININQMLIVETPRLPTENYQEKIEGFKDAVKSITAVKNVSVSSAIPGKNYNYSTKVKKQSDEGFQEKSSNITYIDENFFDNYDIALVAGRSYKRDNADDFKNKIIINEALAQLVGFVNPIDAVGANLIFGNDGNSKEVIGVVPNYHHQSLQNAYDPIAYQFRLGNGSFSIRLSSENMETYSSIVKQVESTYRKFFGNDLFEYFFLDQYFNTKYNIDMLLGKIFAIFTSLAVFIACLGLFGLASFITISRTKEISIRKIHGATIFSLINLLCSDFVKLIILAALPVIPITWYFASDWLQNYAFRISLEIWFFLLPVVILSSLALFTVLSHTLKAVSVNPAKTLRAE
ncbi:MAG: ABC transporter permease [Bacteroidota bacterium]